MIASGMLYAAQTVQHRLLVTRNLRGKFGKRGKLLLGADLKQQLQPQKFSIEIAGKAEQRREASQCSAYIGVYAATVQPLHGQRVH